MRLNRFTDYSLRVLMYLASCPDGHATIAEIAAAFAVSESHLAKVVHHLGRTGLLSNVRGHGGGIELGRPAAQINIGAVVRTAEAEAALVECFDRRTNRCVITPACKLRGVLSEALEAFYATLDKNTLADLTQNRQRFQKVLAARRVEQ